LLHHHNATDNRAQVIDVAHHALVKPKEGTLGTELAITGNDFGSKKGKVLLGDAALKVLEWTNTTIRCLLSKAMPIGTYPVTILRKEPKGVSPLLEEGAFAVKGPMIYEIDPGEGSVGDLIILRGKFFGSKKGKVLIGGKSCKVISWTMDPKTGESEIQFLVPKGLAPGTHDVIVVTKVGTAFEIDGFEILP